VDKRRRRSKRVKNQRISNKLNKLKRKRKIKKKRKRKQKKRKRRRKNKMLLIPTHQLTVSLGKIRFRI